MKRRTVLGLAGTVLVGCNQQQPVAPNAVTPRRIKIGHVTGGGNNYEWGSEKYQHRAQMLALTVMLFNGTSEPGKPVKTRGYFIDFKNNKTQASITPPDNPLKDVDARIYKSTWDYCDSLGWDVVNNQLWSAATIMKDLANKGLATVRVDAYTNPDECPCAYEADYDCPPVNPLL